LIVHWRPFIGNLSNSFGIEEKEKDSERECPLKHLDPWRREFTFVLSPELDVHWETKCEVYSFYCFVFRS
jgi:hypothetical protein